MKKVNNKMMMIAEGKKKNSPQLSKNIQPQKVLTLTQLQWQILKFTPSRGMHLGREDKIFLI